VRGRRFSTGDRILQDEKGRAVLFAPGMDLDDVGVLEAGDRLGLLAEAGQGLGIGAAIGMDPLGGDQPVEAMLAGLVHLAHAAGAQPLQQLVIPQARRRSAPVRRPAGGG
jgi:hypothetical protein